ncbi:hypothetical protein F2Q69_00052570 [Brassica cretica]|uniref:Uncharacterized protein n=1 Tax=Brassica cretica TaxID=69181 RepID=A0A8S9MV04_BRACR|nr:hypothetical protein F2Q69_00052570 [Brassica cretica]
MFVSSYPSNSSKPFLDPRAKGIPENESQTGLAVTIVLIHAHTLSGVIRCNTIAPNHLPSAKQLGTMFSRC